MGDVMGDEDVLSVVGGGVFLNKSGSQSFANRMLRDFAIIHGKSKYYNAKSFSIWIYEENAIRITSEEMFSPKCLSSLVLIRHPTNSSGCSHSHGV
jgi:hypothetical protein